MVEQDSAGLLPPTFFVDNNRWLVRAEEYRQLGEPLDIANWYYKNKHWEFKVAKNCEAEGYHYADGIVDELRDTNERRPDRYVLLQQRQAAASGHAESSMAAAHRLKALLGNRKWQEVARVQAWRRSMGGGEGWAWGVVMGLVLGLGLGLCLGDCGWGLKRLLLALRLCVGHLLGSY